MSNQSSCTTSTSGIEDTSDNQQSQSPLESQSLTVQAAASPEVLSFTPALSAQFREKIRPVLNSIDRLRSHGLQNELRLPSVAVVGDQSVGKSSVLEAISGVCLPRGSGIVTRCPLQLSMRSGQQGQWKGHISYKNQSDQRIDHDIPDKSQVDKFVKEAQNAITGSTTGVSKQQIDLTIESDDVSDLTLIDLPGIARYSETHANISNTTKDLIRFYIGQEQVIILVVVPCNVDIETVEAIALAKEVDPQGLRTIGVMTCPDLTNPGSEEAVISILQNLGTVKLKKGFVMVKCRSPQELKASISLSDMSKMEAEFFANHAHFSQISKDLVGTKTLAEKLTDELFRAVAKGMAALETDLKTKLEEYNSELKALSDCQCESDDDKRYYLMRKLQQFLSRVGAITAVSSDGYGALNSGTTRLYTKCRSQCSQFGRQMEHIKPDWISDFSRPIPAAITTEVQQLRGRELPTFTFVFPIVYKIVRETYLPKVAERSVELLETIRSLVAKALLDIASELFHAFPDLVLAVQRTLLSLTNSMEAECKADLLKLIAHEKHVFTQDSLFSVRHEEATNRRRETSLQTAGTAFSQSKPAATAAKPTFGFSTQAGSAPSSAGQNQQAEISIEEKVRLGTSAYLSVASQRIADTVPMSVLCHMLDGVAADLEREMTHLFCDGGGSRVLPLLQELPDRKRRRRHLTEAVEQMKLSQAEMLKAKQNSLEL